MRYIYDNDLHIHSKISPCSNDPEQTNERILAYATQNNLKTICLTDHFWDSAIEGSPKYCEMSDYEYISKALPLPQTDKTRFLFGCETELRKDYTLGVTPETLDKFDFIVIPTTHFHMVGETIPEDAVSVQQKSELWFSRFDAVLNMDLPFHKIGIAHLTCDLMFPEREKLLEMVSSLSESKLTDIFTKAAEKGVGIELNSYDMKFKDDESEIILKPYKIAKKCGCKFYMGSDAHHPEGLDAAKDAFERAIDLLNLTEDDKFKLR